jgi:HJR/Mrr/RecB family endonuclease
MTVYKLHYSKDTLFKLAKKGNDEAMYSIGYRYLEGIGGLPKNSVKAQEWFEKSADAGNQHALMIMKAMPVVIIEKQPVIIPIKPVNIETTELTYQAAIPESSYTAGDLTLILSLVLLVGFIFFRYKFLKNREEKLNYEIRVINQQINTLINQHIKVLSLKYKQTVVYDDYGNIFYDKWALEVAYFITHVLAKQIEIRKLLETEDLINGYPSRSDIEKRIMDIVQLYEQQTDAVHPKNRDVELLSPIEFEHYCSDILKKNGWQARVTQASGDQGVDIIAKYDNVNVAFQCKKYSSPIGNKAVQEIIAGKKFVQADIAAVVSNSRYTSSAKQLANVTGVHLLHYSELRQFNQKIYQPKGYLTSKGSV